MAGRDLQGEKRQGQEFKGSEEVSQHPRRYVKKEGGVFRKRSARSEKRKIAKEKVKKKGRQAVQV